MWEKQPVATAAHDQETGEVFDVRPPAPANLAVREAAHDEGILGSLVRLSQSIERDLARMIQTAEQLGGLLAEDAFYSFPAGGDRIEGPSIDLAQALAQAWGGIVYEVRMLSSETLPSGARKIRLRATVTDARTLVAASVDQEITTSPPPAKFARNVEQTERWHSMQVQSASSRAVRNVILRVLPAWYVSAGLRAAKNQASKNALGGKGLPEARTAAVAHMGKLGLTQPELEEIVGMPVELWASPQLSTLRGFAEEMAAGRLSVERVRSDLAAARKAPAATGTAGLKEKLQQAQGQGQPPAGDGAAS